MGVVNAAITRLHRGNCRRELKLGSIQKRTRSSSMKLAYLPFPESAAPGPFSGSLISKLPSMSCGASPESL